MSEDRAVVPVPDLVRNLRAYWNGTRDPDIQDSDCRDAADLIERISADAIYWQDLCLLASTERDKAKAECAALRAQKQALLDIIALMERVPTLTDAQLSELISNCKAAIVKDAP